MDRIKNHFESEAHDFDEIIIKRVPRYTEMINVLVEAVPFDRDKEIKVLDMGCGTGTITKEFKAIFPNAKVTCLDLAENMIKVSREKLKGLDNIEFINTDVEDFDFQDKYDAVITSLTLHHVWDVDNKKKLYKKIYDGLNPGGVFYNADIVKWSTEYLDNMYMQKWGEFMKLSLNGDEVQDTFNKYHAEDRPFRLIDELGWLKDIGYKNIEVIWRSYNGAVYGGEK